MQAMVAAAGKSSPRTSPSELWRWACQSPAVHIVSRRVQSPSLSLHDAVLARHHLRGRSEEAAFAEDEVLSQRLRRGLTFIQSATDGSPCSSADVCIGRRGLPKFFDLDTDALYGNLTPSSSSAGHNAHITKEGQAARDRRDIASRIASQIQHAFNSGARVGLVRLGKANGENAQISFFAPAHQWLLCSKNVALMAASREDIVNACWADHRYRFAREIANLWFAQLNQLPTERVADLQRELSTQTLVGEMIGGASHLVDYGNEHGLRFFAIVPNGGDKVCLAPDATFSLLRQFGLPAVASELLGDKYGYGTTAELLAALQQASVSIGKSSILDEGEGCVMYLTARTQNQPATEEVLALGKLKTAEYKLLRRIREKTKTFARAGGSVLVSDVVDEFKAEAMQYPFVEPQRVEILAATLEKICRLVFAEDIPPEHVDESFRDVLRRAEDFRGSEQPRAAEPAVCIVAPPFLMDCGLQQRLRQCVGVPKDSIPLADILRSGPSAASHLAAAGRPALYLPGNPIIVEKALCMKTRACSAKPPPAKEGCDNAAGPRKRRRKTVVAEEELRKIRESKALGTAAELLRKRQCLFVFWGWSTEGLTRSLELTRDTMHRRTSLASESPVPPEVTNFSKQEGKHACILEKWRCRAHSLSMQLPSNRRLWFDAPPGLNSARAMSTIASNVEHLRQNGGKGAVESTVVTVILPIGIPGMGKSSILEHIFSASGSRAKKRYLQGQATDSSELGDHSLASVSLLSSDKFSNEEMRSQGIAFEDDDKSPEGQACLRRGRNRFNLEVEKFMKRVAIDASAKSAQEPADSETFTAQSADHHLLILDKNYPPTGLKKEVENLKLLRPLGCELHVKALALSSFRSPPSLGSIEAEEVKEFGEWAYPWIPEALLECAARLLQRSSHDTLVGSDQALFILLSFIRLHKGIRKLGRTQGVEVINVPYVSIDGDLATWPSLSNTDPESVWARLEARALLRMALADLKPFENSSSSRPLLAALRACAQASGLRHVPDAVRKAHLETITKEVLHGILSPPARPVIDELVAPPITYIAMSVNQHQPKLQSILRQAANAMNGETDGVDPYPAPTFKVPQSLHVTTCFLGGAAKTPDERSMLSESRKLFRNSASFDCEVTHVVCARGALACAVVDRARLVDSRVPMNNGRHPHITLCTRYPWKPKHSNDILQAVAGTLQELPASSSPGSWMRSVQIASAVLDVFIYPLPEPLHLPCNPLLLN